LGKSSNTTPIKISEESAPLLGSSLSIFIRASLSLKNISKASKIVDFPMSFFPMNTVRLSKSIVVVSLNMRKFFNTSFLIFIFIPPLITH